MSITSALLPALVTSSAVNMLTLVASPNIQKKWTPNKMSLSLDNALNYYLPRLHASIEYVIEGLTLSILLGTGTTPLLVGTAFVAAHCFSVLWMNKAKEELNNCRKDLLNNYSKESGTTVDKAIKNYDKAHKLQHVCLFVGQAIIAAGGIVALTTLPFSYRNLFFASIALFKAGVCAKMLIKDDCPKPTIKL